MSKDGGALFCSYPHNPQPTQHPQQKHLIDIVCTSCLDNICTASLSDSLKAVQKLLPK